MKKQKPNVLKIAFDDFLNFEGIEGFVKGIMMVITPLAAAGTLLLLRATLSSFANGLEVLGTTLMLGTGVVGVVFLVNLGFLIAEFISSYRVGLSQRKFYMEKEHEENRVIMGERFGFIKSMFEGIEGYVLLIFLGLTVVTTVSTGLLIWGMLSSFGSGYEFLGTVLLVCAGISGFFWLQGVFFSTWGLIKSFREVRTYRS